MDFLVPAEQPAIVDPAQALILLVPEEGGFLRNGENRTLEHSTEDQLFVRPSESREFVR